MQRAAARRHRYEFSTGSGTPMKSGARRCACSSPPVPEHAHRRCACGTARREGPWMLCRRDGLGIREHVCLIPPSALPSTSKRRRSAAFRQRLCRDVAGQPLRTLMISRESAAWPQRQEKCDGRCHTQVRAFERRGHEHRTVFRTARVKELTVQRRAGGSGEESVVRDQASAK